jgi:hypothetical protein
MLPGPTTVTSPINLHASRYSIHVRHHGRWMRATELDSLREAELVAKMAHRRSGLPIEVRSQTGTVCLAIDPTSSVSVSAE